ncbi:TetR family transcriptional regulator [Aggregicoccus sp. 17bor-14]|uniref:TetR family transcriptional regulator n=1 Tax=Myxococcaceae TaxID=31 RepID=UPI00129CF255|nr:MULTISPECIES: TetR family transcriptional regulator [Myxococcaceae]MBF5046579.1 TetR family transcriptional regulator [Simulacricoccus sp. 17bor-14]MRI92290.1 TetR family transcriptional regulator [Aggregicoccus sp. 17bor-14]
MPRRPLLALLLALALVPAGARAAAPDAGTAGAPGTAAPGAPGALARARSEAAEARAALAALRSRQAALRTELNALGARIEELKAERQGKLRTGDELEGALRRSQELSEELSRLAQQASAAEGASRTRALALHAALGAELQRLRAAWEATPEREAREALLAQMRTLRAERDGVRAALPAGELPALAAEGPASTDDPEDLLQQADALRDSRDKVRQRLAVLQGHIAELREARDLERRMSDFLGDEAMFDEQDRRLNVRREGGSALRVERTPPTGGGQVGAGDPGEPAPIVATPAPTPPGAPDQPPPPTSSPAGAPSPTSSARDLRPQVGGVRAQALAGGAPEDLGQLEAEAARLDALARELERRAAALEARGRERE